MIYTWKCNVCDAEWDGHTDDYNQAPPACQCGGESHKIIKVAPPVHYIGPDWYETEWGASRHNCAGRLTSAIEQEEPVDGE